MDNQAIGNFIKALRTEQGLTQKQLAEKINVTDKAVSRWETGKGAPDVTLLMPLSQLFGVSVNELLRGERIQADQKLEKSEETILETLTQSKKRISRLHAIIYALFALVEAVAIYGFTFNASPSDAMGLLIGLAFIVTPLTSLLLGITNVPVSLKMLFPILCLVLFVPSNFLYWNGAAAWEIAALYGAAHLVLSYGFVLLGMGIHKLFRKLCRTGRGTNR